MTARPDILSMQLTVPHLENIQAILSTYFLTSDQGNWVVDSEGSSLPLKLVFRRGHWRKTLTGKARPGNPNEYRASTFPCQLTLTVRPSPDHHTVGVRYQFFSSGDAVLSYRYGDILVNYAIAETEGLHSYLCDLSSAQPAQMPGLATNSLGTKRTSISALYGQFQTIFAHAHEGVLVLHTDAKGDLKSLIDAFLFTSPAGEWEATPKDELPPWRFHYSRGGLRLCVKHRPRNTVQELVFEFTHEQQIDQELIRSEIDHLVEYLREWNPAARYSILPCSRTREYESAIADHQERKRRAEEERKRRAEEELTPQTGEDSEREFSWKLESVLFTLGLVISLVGAYVINLLIST